MIGRIRALVMGPADSMRAAVLVTAGLAAWGVFLAIGGRVSQQSGLPTSRPAGRIVYPSTAPAAAPYNVPIVLAADTTRYP